MQTRFHESVSVDSSSRVLCLASPRYIGHSTTVKEQTVILLHTAFKRLPPQQRLLILIAMCLEVSYQASRQLCRQCQQWVCGPQGLTSARFVLQCNSSAFWFEMGFNYFNGIILLVGISRNWFYTFTPYFPLLRTQIEAARPNQSPVLSLAPLIMLWRFQDWWDPERNESCRVVCCVTHFTLDPSNKFP